MITCPPRREERARTLAQFERHGLDVTVFLDPAPIPSPAANRSNAERAIHAAVNADSDLLLVEDDIDLASDFPLALIAARGRGPVTFWLDKPHTHPPAWERVIEGGGTQPVGFYPVRRFKGSWYGSQCLLLPLEVLRALQRAPHFGVPTGNPFDRWVREQLEGLMVALPNPVQHRSPPAVVDPNRKRRISPTYHMRRDGAWEEGNG